MSKVVDGLKAIRAKIESGWCKHAEAKNYRGEEVPPWTPGACSWCLLGAGRSLPTYLSTATASFLVSASRERGFRFVSKFNDHPDTTKEDVLSLVDRAIELATAEVSNG